MIELRPYQKEATAATWEWLRTHDGNPLVVASVGAGKSLMMGQFIKDCVEAWPQARIVLATHSAALVEQNHAKLLEIYPECDVGIYAAGLGRKQKKTRVLVGTIQSLWRRAFDLQDPSAPDILIVDEAHTISRKAETMWHKFICDLKVMQPDLRMVGYSGTHWRLESGYLHEGPGAMFDGIAYEIGMLELIKLGYLCPLVTVPATVQINLAGVPIRSGEYGATELGKAALAITEAAVDEIVLHGADRRAWMVFASSRESAFTALAAIRARGFSCEIILADTPAAERTITLNRLRTHALRAVVNVGTLTTGVDVPCVDLIAAIFASKSSVRFVQVGGRGMRIYPGKENCLFLDFGGIIAEHGPIDQARPKPKKPGAASGAPMKTCPECEASVLISIMTCPECGNEFDATMGEESLNPKASSLAILSTQAAIPQWVDVGMVRYARHPGRAGKQDTMLVTYQCGLMQHREWVCIEHTGYPRQKAAGWWQRRAPGRPVPNTVQDALDQTDTLPSPVAIRVKPSGKYIEITEAKFA